ncbi:hypothetical protein N0V90_011641 [Kalmusia sp. IMI 367209]|nr:hypothetical protein N0V90_011641 [Kalmusia sp. IMI 367209]
MTTTAISAPHLEITAPDTMDLHSDSGLDFGDVDLDLDLRSTVGLDDDVSVRDAATDAGLDAQTVPGDNDDFMADNDDLIDEDIVEEDIEVDLDLQSAEPTNFLESEPVAVEEDLIDYSDDEDTPLDKALKVTDSGQNEYPDNSAAAKASGEQANVTSPSRIDDHAGADDFAVQHAQNPHKEQTESVTVEEQHVFPAQQPGMETALEHPDQPQLDVHDGSKSPNKANTSPERGTSPPQAHVPVTTGAKDNSIEPSEQSSQDISAHPITVNYDGAELWLFKHHDYENSGEYLVDNNSLANQPISAVLEACREALGADISNDLELGFRLDCFHGIELYQDHTSCAFVTLDHIVRVYLQLHAQDGNSDPESFYMTLVSRPRISSLLHELIKAAAEGIGHSGLNNAIVSGQTAFNAHYSHNSTEQVFDDFGEGNEREEEEEQTSSKASEQYEYEGEHHEDNEGEDMHMPHGEHNEEQYQENHSEQVLSGADGNTKVEPAAAIIASDKSVSENTNLVVEQHAEHNAINSALSDQQSQGPQEDLIDYSDDEDEGETQGSQAEATRPSSASSTIQGDDQPQAQYDTENVAQNEQESGQEDGSTEEAAHDGPAGEGDEVFAEYQDHDYTYEEFDDQAYGEAYDGEYVREDDENQELKGYAGHNAAQANDENTNYLDDFGEHAAGHADNLSVAAGFNPGENEHVGVDDILTAADDFLSFDDTAAAAHPVESNLVKDTRVEDEIDFDDDDEDGAVSQAPVAASAAADTVATSSSGLQTLSPQGQKRTIDEVGNDVVDATNLTDAKRPRV